MKFKSIVESEYIKLSTIINNIINDNSNYSIELHNSLYDEKTLNIINEDNKKIISCKYQILGSYDVNCNIFSWAYTSQLMNKKMTYLSKDIKKTKKIIMEYIVKSKYDDVDYIEQIYYYLSNSICYITNLDDLLKYCVYVTNCLGFIKQNMIISNNSNDNNDNNEKINIYLVMDIIGT
jgi:hypothetical protein